MKAKKKEIKTSFHLCDPLPTQPTRRQDSHHKPNKTNRFNFNTNTEAAAASSSSATVAAAAAVAVGSRGNR